MGILLMLIIAIASIACLVSFFKTPSGKPGTADSNYADDANDDDDDDDDEDDEDDEYDEDDDEDDEGDDDTIRCPNCGSPAQVRGDQWECGWCGDSGFIRRR